MPFNNQKLMDQALKVVPDRWKTAFVHFVQTSEGSDAFLGFLNENEECLAAIDAIINGEEGISFLMKLATEEGRDIEPINVPAN